jgi:cytochrome c oxidase subunit II
MVPVPPWQRYSLVPVALALLCGCAVEPDQSMLHPAGPASADIATLWWVMFAVFTAVFVFVMVLLLYAILRRASAAAADGPSNSANQGPVPPWGRTGFILGGGVIFPIVVLAPLYIYSLRTSASMHSPDAALTVRVVGHMWWWEVSYPDRGIVTANEIHIPVGEPVRLELASADVIHSFWVPRLNGKRDMIPGIENTFWIEASEPGVYRGQCGEYCGTQHANMAFHVIALSREEFDAWVAERMSPRLPPLSATEQRGLQVFKTAGCVECHTVQDMPAKANVGPDLTHMGSRQTIGAALLPNTRGNLAGWIADPQAIKPGIKMPRTFIAADDLQALVTYLEGLK